MDRRRSDYKNNDAAGLGTDEISLIEIAQIMLRHIKLIILVAVIGGLLAASVTYFMITPKYASEVRLYVNNGTPQQTEGISSADINASQSLVNTYIAMLGSNICIDAVIKKSELKYTNAQISSMMSAAAVNNTEVFYIRIVSEDPAVAKLLADTFADIAVEKIPEYVDGSSVRIIDSARESASPVSPNLAKNTAMGILAGLILAALAAFAIELLDTRIKEESDLARIGDYPVLGRIPDIEELMRDSRNGHEVTAAVNTDEIKGGRESGDPEGGQSNEKKA